MIKYINREQLYKQVWREPFTKLAPKHNVSATDLRKVCDKFCIPVFKQGHWQRIYFGHKVEVPDCLGNPIKSYTILLNAGLTKIIIILSSIFLD